MVLEKNKIWIKSITNLFLLKALSIIFGRAFDLAF